MEQLLQTALFPICQYIKGNGNRCGSPALSGARFCYHHFGGSVAALKRAHAQVASSSASNSGKLNFVDPTSREAIQHNLFVIAQGINDGMVDLAVAHFYHRLFRTCEINFTRWERTHKDNPEQQMELPNPVAPAETGSASAHFVLHSDAYNPVAPAETGSASAHDVVIPTE